MTIRSKVIAGYLLLIVIPSTITYMVYSYFIEQSVIQDIQASLNGKAAVQKARLEEMIHANYERVLSITNRTSLRQYLLHYLETGDPADIGRLKKNLVDAENPFPDFGNIFILSEEGRLITATHPNEVLEDFTRPKLFKEGQNRLVAALQAKPSKHLEMLLMGPIYLEGRRLGVLGIAARNTTIARVAQDFTGLGKTGETLIVKIDENGNGTFILPQRFSDHPRASSAIPMHELRRPSTQALFRYEGLLDDAVDYRGEEVFAATRYIQEEDWGVVVKIDKKEVLEPVRHIRLIGCLVLGIGLGAGLFCSLFFVRRMVEPIRRFTHVFPRLSANEFNEKIRLDRDDELGDLSRAFDRMVDRLHQETEKRKLFEQNLNSRNRELETLLNIISHDLKEPLRGVNFFTSMARERYGAQLDDKGRDYLERAAGSALTMSRLLEDIETLSRTRTFKIPEEPVPGREIVDQVLDRLALAIQSSSARIDIEGEFPLLHVDRPWAVQALYNLVSNALKFSKPGEAPEIQIAPYASEGKIGFIVRDRGIGITEEYREKIFELFRRAVGHEVEGTGAGLAIVREIARKHGGNAWALMREGGGTEFYLSFAALRK